MHVLTLLDDFSAAHHLPSSGGRCERLHGHNWKVEVQVWAEELDGSGMVIDFHELRALTREILEELDHCLLNELPAFQHRNPTAENLARHVYERLVDRLPEGRVKLDRVRVWESDTTAATYRPGASPHAPGPEKP